MSARDKSRQAPKSKHEFHLRKTQLFGPYGVGAIMPCPGGESLMICGLDAFPYKSDSDMEEVRDPRLAKHIGVRKLLAPRESTCIPATRFPRWLYCPECHTMVKCRDNDLKPPKCQNRACKGYGRRDLIPERFIVVCPDGHIDDLPILEWVHRGHVDNPDRHTIKRVTKGGTASLADIEYKCSCSKCRSLAGITNKGALAEIGYQCSGNKPWLRQHGNCTADPNELMVVQRGGTNVWYADVFSSIFIPSGKDPQLVSKVETNYENLKIASSNPIMLDAMASTIAGNDTMKKEAVISIFHDMDKEDDGDCSDGDFMEDEYRVLKDATLNEKSVFEACLVPNDSYHSDYISQAIDSISLVSTLRETRALVGFSRLLPDHNDGLSFAERRAQLSRRKRVDWTIGLQSIGEGIFLSFNKEALEKWMQTRGVKNRFAIMQNRYDEHCDRQDKPHETLNPLYALIHTLAHVLMLSLSEECGYSAASVRERIYCDKTINDNERHENMLGLLIYTASSDSEGSLGGLVRSGKPGRFEKIFDSAIEKARWCSCDPICIESPGQGPESCNLAACYSCALVPETSCENGNRLLDRGLLVGTLDNNSIGFFKSEKNVEGATLQQVFILSPDFDEGTDLSNENFDTVCRQALAEAGSESEKTYINKLLEIGEGKDLEMPWSDVPFSSIEDDDAVVATLVWRRSGIALLVGPSAHEFAELGLEPNRPYGEYTFVSIESNPNPYELLARIGER